MTEFVTISGVHGAGKTTVINAVANRLRRAGFNVYALPEFPYIPDIKIGTMDFQAWYAKAMEDRDLLIDALNNLDYFDVVILDRHPLDVAVYTQRLHHPEVKVVDVVHSIAKMHEFTFASGRQRGTYMACFVLDRDTDDIIESLEARREKEVHRKEWNEEDKQYIDEIRTWFKLFRSNDKVIHINNKDLQNTIDWVFEEIAESLNA